MFGHREMNMGDYLSILRRRKWWIVIPALIGPVLGYSISLFLPAQYLSQTTVLVDPQRVPWVPSVVSDTLTQRLSTMKDQILSRTQLQPLIEKYKLYQDEKVPMEDLIDKMRRNITVKNLTNAMGGGQTVNGFSISFTADDPHVAQQVTGQILSMFIEENVKLRSNRAQDTTDFFDSQLQEAKRKLDEQDQRLANFKRQYMGQLPGQETTILGLLTAANNQYEAVTQDLNRAAQDKQFTESMLANQLQAWKASQQTGVNPVTIDAQLTSLENQLLDLQARYTPDHPDVLKVKSQIEQLKSRAAKISKDPQEKPVNPVSAIEPPQIAQLRAQIHQYNVMINEKTREQERLRGQVQLYQGRLQLSPAVEQQYKELTRDYQTALSFYDDLLQKKTQSQMSKDLESRQQGEQFKVMDAPNLPERPSFPDRRLFAGGGLGAGLALGLGIALLWEIRDQSLRTELDVEVCLQIPALVCLPSIDLLESKGRKVIAARSKG